VGWWCPALFVGLGIIVLTARADTEEAKRGNCFDGIKTTEKHTAVSSTLALFTNTKKGHDLSRTQNRGRTHKFNKQAPVSNKS
jgi:hypothetical protein